MLVVKHLGMFLRNWAQTHVEGYRESSCLDCARVQPCRQLISCSACLTCGPTAIQQCSEKRKRRADGVQVRDDGSAPRARISVSGHVGQKTQPVQGRRGQHW